jgi:hypothetical protein
MTTIENITKETITTLLEVGVDDSAFFSHNIRTSEVAAECIMEGARIPVCDWYVEDRDEKYGKLPARFVRNPIHIEYFVGLENIKRGLQRCMEDEHLAKSVERLLEDDPAFDINDAESIMQVIVFGEIVYG